MEQPEKAQIVVNNADRQVAESFLTLHSALRLKDESKNAKCFLTTSTVPGEGKSFITTNLALTFAAHGERVVVGFGVNLAAAPDIPERPAAHLGGRVTPEAFAPLLAGAMGRMLMLWRTTDPRDFAKAWLARAHPVGTDLSVHGADAAAVRGQFAGIEPDGTLRLLLADGSVELVRAGDVALG